MTLSANTTWEVRTDGDDANGGGFVTGAAGTDYSQQVSAQKSGTDLTMHSSTNTKCHPVGAGVAAADVGNIIQISAGTNWTVGFYEIKSQDGTDWTLDRSPAAAGEVNAATYKMGGALRTIGKALATNAGLSALVPGNIVWVRSGTYSINTGLVVSDGTSVPINPSTHLSGYGTTRGDRGRPTIQTSSAIKMVAIGSANIHVANLILDGGDVATHGLSITTGYQFRNTFCDNIKVSRCTTFGIDAGLMFNCEVTDMAPGATGGFGAGNAIRCYAHDNPCSGFSFGNTNNEARYIQCVSANNTGASSHGFSLTTALGSTILYGCIAHNNEGDGVNVGGSYLGVVVSHSILSSNGRYGLSSGLDMGRLPGESLHNYNAFFNNTSGERNSTQTASDDDITLTVDPFVDSANGDFRPNTLTGGGLLLREAGLYGVDVGAYQRAVDSFGGAADCLTLSKETGANARGGSGTCAKLLPTSTTAYGHWTWFVPTDGTAFTLSFYYNCTSGFNGDIDVTIYDIDNATKLNDAEDVGETADGDWHQFTATQVDPSGTGLCRVVVSVKQGAHSAADVIYIDDIAVA